MKLSNCLTVLGLAAVVCLAAAQQQQGGASPPMMPQQTGGAVQQQQQQGQVAQGAQVQQGAQGGQAGQGQRYENLYDVRRRPPARRHTPKQPPPQLAPTKFGYHPDASQAAR